MVLNDNFPNRENNVSQTFLACDKITWKIALTGLIDETIILKDNVWWSVCDAEHFCT